MNVFDDGDETSNPTPPGWEQRTKALVPAGARTRRQGATGVSEKHLYSPDI
jgi:hypothetical protein